MAKPKHKRFVTEDGMVHWAYPMLGTLTVCGQSKTPGRDATDAAPTCLRCVATVQVVHEGDLTVGRANDDPTRKYG